jgi:hypothetical protein
MGRVTFQDAEVIRRVNGEFCATWTNVQPGYKVEHLEGARFEEVKQIPNGQASENVVTLLCTPKGELLHVVPGHWKPKEYLKEIDFALSVAQAVSQAGTDRDARRKAVIEKHRERLAMLDQGWYGGSLGRLVMENVHRRMLQEPLRPVSEVRGIEDYALNAATNILAQKVKQLQQAMQQRQQEGKDLIPVAAVMQGFDQLLQSGRLREAEARVDKALGMLGERFVPNDAVLTPPLAAFSPADLPESIRRKMQRASELAEQWQRDGRDLTPVARILNEVEPLLRHGKFKEAEMVLDHGLRLLGNGRKREIGKTTSQVGRLEVPSGPTQRTASPESLIAEIEALKPAKSVWRAIAWKSCLLEALNVAREEKKPVLLWVLGGEPTEGRC